MCSNLSINLFKSSPKQSLPEIGDFEHGDLAHRVLGAKISNQNGFIMIKVSWERRADGTVPRPNMYPS